MGRAQKVWARKKLDYFRACLGNLCHACGADDDNENLEIDCIVPQGHEHHKMSTDQRATFYWRQFLIDNLQLLCKECHAAKTKEENKQLDLQPINDEDVPF